MIPMHKHRTHDDGASPRRFAAPDAKPDLRLFKKEQYYVCALMRKNGPGTTVYFAVRLNDADAKRIAELDRLFSSGNGSERLRAERALMLGGVKYFRMGKEGEYRINQAVEGYPTDWQPYS